MLFLQDDRALSAHMIFSQATVFAYFVELSSRFVVMITNVLDDNNKCMIIIDNLHYMF